MVSVAGMSECLKTCWEPNLSLCLRRSDAISCIAACQKTSVINSKVIWSLSNAFMASPGQMSHLGLGSLFPNHGFEWHCLCRPWENQQEEFRRTLGCFDRTPFRHQLPRLCSQWRPPHWIQVRNLWCKTFHLKSCFKVTDSWPQLSAVTSMFRFGTCVGLMTALRSWATQELSIATSMGSTTSRCPPWEQCLPQDRQTEPRVFGTWR